MHKEPRPRSKPGSTRSAMSAPRAILGSSADLDDAPLPALFRKIGEFENQEAQAKREIRNDLLRSNPRNLPTPSEPRARNWWLLLERRSQELQHQKTDRAALASLFSEVSMRLGDQFKVTSAD